VRYLVDTNVISELCKPKSSPVVLEWIQAQSPESLYMSAISVGEIERGIARLPAGKRRARIEAWWTELVNEVYAARILPYDGKAAAVCGRVMGELDTGGMSLPWPDVMIAAIAKVHSLTVATRDVSDFERIGTPVLNPWQA
jgi:hypothetical protein